MKTDLFIAEAAPPMEIKPKPNDQGTLCVVLNRGISCFLVLRTSGDFLFLALLRYIPFGDYFLFFLGFLSNSKVWTPSASSAVKWRKMKKSPRRQTELLRRSAKSAVVGENFRNRQLLWEKNPTFFFLPSTLHEVWSVKQGVKMKIDPFQWKL